MNDFLHLLDITVSEKAIWNMPWVVMVTATTLDGVNHQLCSTSNGYEAKPQVPFPQVRSLLWRGTPVPALLFGFSMTVMVEGSGSHQSDFSCHILVIR